MNLTKVISLTSVAAFTVGVSYAAMAEDALTVAEVKEKVTAAAAALTKDKAAVKEFDGKNAKWAWKDTYVFVFDCKANKAIAHPTLAGKPIMDIKDPKGTPVFGGDKGLCKAAEQPGGGWVGYIWSKKDGTKAPKASFAMKVEGTTYEVAAGLHTDKKVDNFQIAK